MDCFDGFIQPAALIGRACDEVVPSLVPTEELPISVRQFISRFVRSVEELEILLLLARPEVRPWSIQQVYDVILSTPQSVERWLEDLSHSGLLERPSVSPPLYQYAAKEELAELVTEVERTYRTRPVRVIETIYKRETDAAQGFADAFKLKNPN